MRGLKFVSLHGRNGYGEAARRYMTGLSEAGVSFSWTPMVPGRGMGLGFEPYEGRKIASTLEPFCNRAIEYDTVLLHAMPEYYGACAAREPGKRVVGYTAWETDRPPRHWPALLNAIDLLLVPCEWNRDVFRAHGVTTPIDVVPHAAPSSALPRERDGRFGVGPHDFCFYTIDEWNSRKAIWRTIDSYLRAFTAGDRVALIVKTTRRDGTRGRWLGRLAGTRAALARTLSRYSRPARVILCTDELDERAMLQLHATGDCYVSLTRGEGWGMSAFDAAAYGRPVIMTGFGGQLDWLGADYPLLVDYQLAAVDSPTARRSYSPDQQWAEADPDHAARLMRQAFNGSVDPKVVGRSLQARVHARFSRATVTQRLLQALS